MRQFQSQGVTQTTQSARAAQRGHEPPADAGLRCPISGETLNDAMRGADGQVYEASALATYQQQHGADRYPGARRSRGRAPFRDQLVRDWVQSVRETGQEPNDLTIDPITCAEFEDPVVASDGHTYDLSTLREIYNRDGRSPFTRVQLQDVAYRSDTIRQRMGLGSADSVVSLGNERGHGGGYYDRMAADEAVARELMDGRQSDDEPLWQAPTDEQIALALAMNVPVEHLMAQAAAEARLQPRFRPARADQPVRVGREVAATRAEYAPWRMVEEDRGYVMEQQPGTFESLGSRLGWIGPAVAGGAVGAMAGGALGTVSMPLAMVAAGPIGTFAPVVLGVGVAAASGRFFGNIGSAVGGAVGSGLDWALGTQGSYHATRRIR